LVKLKDSIDFPFSVGLIIKISEPLGYNKLYEWIVTYRPLESDKTHLIIISDEDFEFFLSKLSLAGINAINFTHLDQIIE